MQGTSFHSLFSLAYLGTTVHAALHFIFGGFLIDSTIMGIPNYENVTMRLIGMW